MVIRICRDWSTWKLNALAHSAISPGAIALTRPTVTTGSRAATGLRNISSSRPMISTMVATPTMMNALLNASWLSRNIATSPVTACRSSLPASAWFAVSRICPTALSSFGSSPMPSNPTLTNCTCPLGESACGPETTAVTRSMLAACSRWARSATVDWSAWVSCWPSVRLTTIVALDSLPWPNACSASANACTDS